MLSDKSAEAVGDAAMISQVSMQPIWQSAPPRLSGALKPRMKSGFDDPRWRLVQRMAASRCLGRSTLLSNFLLFVCDRYLAGRPDEITEQLIGIHVFGRSAGYNSGDDNIVRSYARTLRKRIDDYFVTEGKDERLIVAIPRGAYLPVFSARVHELPEISAAPLRDEYPAASQRDGGSLDC